MKHRLQSRLRLEVLESRTLLTFLPPVNYPISLISSSVAAGDFDGNGAPDVVVASGTGIVGVRLNNGDGTFKNVVNYNAGASAYWVTVGEFNGDGRADIVVANLVAAKVNLLLGNGNGTFQAPKSFSTGPDAAHVVAGDANNDGRQDLVVASSKSNSVNILLGNGNGTFKPFKKYRAGSDPFGVAIGDFNNDGKPDVVVANLKTLNSTVSVLRGNGDGTFSRPATYYALGRETRDVAAVDMNADGNLDIVAANSGSATACIMLGNGNGTFQDAKTYDAGLATMHLSVADFDGNSTLDVAMVNYVYPVGHVSVLPGLGDGSLGALVKYEVGNSPFALTSADFNADGAPDLAVVNAYSNNMSILINAPGLRNSMMSPSDIALEKADVIHLNPAPLSEDWETHRPVSDQAPGGKHALRFSTYRIIRLSLVDELDMPDLQT